MLAILCTCMYLYLCLLCIKYVFRLWNTLNVNATSFWTYSHTWINLEMLQKKLNILQKILKYCILQKSWNIAKNFQQVQIDRTKKGLDEALQWSILFVIHTKKNIGIKCNFALCAKIEHFFWTFYKYDVPIESEIQFGYLHGKLEWDSVFFLCN